jgi:Holliday junction resolvasome RuvABC endonuclease subunit
MRTAGIDIASAGYSSVALAVNGVPRRAVIWKPKSKKDSSFTTLGYYYKWVKFQLRVINPDVVVVEQLAVFMNKKTIRALSHFEAAALLAAKQSGAIVVNPVASQVRGIVLGNGRLSKDDAWVAFKKLYPDFLLLAKNHGGLDQMDAMTHALAGPTVLERR